MAARLSSRVESIWNLHGSRAPGKTWFVDKGFRRQKLEKISCGPSNSKKISKKSVHARSSPIPFVSFMKKRTSLIADEVLYFLFEL